MEDGAIPPIYIPFPPLHFLNIVTSLLLAKSVAALMFSAQLSHLINQNIFFSLLFVFPGVSNCQFALFSLMKLSLTHSQTLHLSPPFIPSSTANLLGDPPLFFLRHSSWTLPLLFQVGNAAFQAAAQLAQSSGGWGELLFTLNLENPFAFRGPFGNHLGTLLPQKEAATQTHTHTQKLESFFIFLLLTLETALSHMHALAFWGCKTESPLWF